MRSGDAHCVRGLLLNSLGRASLAVDLDSLDEAGV